MVLLIWSKCKQIQHNFQKNWVPSQYCRGGHFFVAKWPKILYSNSKHHFRSNHREGISDSACSWSYVTFLLLVFKPPNFSIQIKFSCSKCDISSNENLQSMFLAIGIMKASLCITNFNFLSFWLARKSSQFCCCPKLKHDVDLSIIWSVCYKYHRFNTDQIYS